MVNYGQAGSVHRDAVAHLLVFQNFARVDGEFKVTQLSYRTYLFYYAGEQSMPPSAVMGPLEMDPGSRSPASRAPLLAD